MEFQEFFRQRRRMCKENTSCYKCELNKGLAGGSRGCEYFILMYPKQAEEIVQKWVAEHPEDTPVPSEDMSKTYEQGLEEAWELAIKISGHILPEDLYKIFNTNEVDEIMNGFTPQESMQKLQEWEDSKIKIGDEVLVEGTPPKGIVVAIDTKEKKVKLIFPETTFRTDRWYYDDLKKTGRNFANQLNALLEMVRCEKND